MDLDSASCLSFLLVVQHGCNEGLCLRAHRRHDCYRKHSASLFTLLLTLASRGRPIRFGASGRCAVFALLLVVCRAQPILQDMQCVENCDDPNPRHHVLYEQPVWQTLQMFRELQLTLSCALTLTTLRILFSQSERCSVRALVLEERCFVSVLTCLNRFPPSALLACKHPF